MTHIPIAIFPYFPGNDPSQSRPKHLSQSSPPPRSLLGPERPWWGRGCLIWCICIPNNCPPRLLFFLSVSKWCARAFVPHFGPLVGVAVYRARAAVQGRNSSWECVCLAALYLVFTGLLFGQS